MLLSLRVIENDIGIIILLLLKRPYQIKSKLYLKRDSFEFCEKVKLHEIFLAEDTGSFPPAIDGRRLDDQLQLRDTRPVHCGAVRVPVHFCVIFRDEKIYNTYVLVSTNTKVQNEDEFLFLVSNDKQDLNKLTFKMSYAMRNIQKKRERKITQRE
jgi:hypothetical protein